MRRSLSGVFFEKRGEQTLRLVATDGHRLSFVDEKIENLNLPKDILVPKKAVMETRKTPPSLEGSQDREQRKFLRF